MPPKPPATEAWRSSITARITAVNDMLDLAVADLTLDQVNRAERKGVLPIAFSLAHVVGSQDRSASRFLANGAPSLWESGDWAQRVKINGGLPFRGAWQTFKVREMERRAKKRAAHLKVVKKNGSGDWMN